MSFADRRRSSGAFIEGRKLSIHSGESFRSHAGKLPTPTFHRPPPRKTQQLKITFTNELRLCIILSLAGQLLHHKFIAGLHLFADWPL